MSKGQSIPNLKSEVNNLNGISGTAIDPMSLEIDGDEKFLEIEDTMKLGAKL